MEKTCFDSNPSSLGRGKWSLQGNSGTADKDSFVSTKKIEEKLGWKSKFSNQDALITSHKWYLEHKGELEHQKAGVTHRVGWDQGILKLFKRWL